MSGINMGSGTLTVNGVAMSFTDFEMSMRRSIESAFLVRVPCRVTLKLAMEWSPLQARLLWISGGCKLADHVAKVGPRRVRRYRIYPAHPRTPGP